MQLQLPEIDFSSLDVREIGAWPLILRIGVIIAAVIVSMVVVYFLIFAGELSSLDSAEKDLQTKMKDFKDKYSQAVNIDAYKKQMQDMQNNYQEYIRELPSESNIPELIDSVTKIAQHENLTINSIKIGDAKLQNGFYMALPLTFDLSGQYHNIGLFVSEISKLPRIVTLGDFTIKPQEGEQAIGMLNVSIQAQTYWLASLSELEQGQAKDSKASKGAKPSAAAGAGAAGEADAGKQHPATPVPTSGHGKIPVPPRAIPGARPGAGSAEGG